MHIGGLSLFQAMADKMRWHQVRQSLLSENVANADTPGFVGRDLKPFKFDDQIQSVAAVSLTATAPGQIAIASDSAGSFGIDSSGYEVNPAGTAVTLEDEMMKVSQNDIDYQTVTALYSRSIRLIRTALGKNV
jgi:flagellar basal-body rod protein FlgB